LPGKVVEKLQRDDSAFYGIFDANGDGEPRLFLDYWPKSGDPDCPKEYRDESHDAEVPCGAVALQVYQRTGDTFREEMKLGAPTAGYSPAAWFIRESPLNKALFMTRCQGSGGNCLYYLDFKKRVLETVSEDCLQADPRFEDIDHDGTAEIFLENRGRDRTAVNGAALMRWDNGNYRIWWPNWSALPYVMYAELSDVDGDGKKEIVAILDPGNESSQRQLGIWKLDRGEWKLIDKVGLPDADDAIELPTFAGVAAGANGTNIRLNYPSGTLECRYRDRTISCLQGGAQRTPVSTFAQRPRPSAGR